ncbi:NACHT, LRR and PYD domains-containing protein 1a allele 5-like [Mantella aurantiaca]
MAVGIPPVDSLLSRLSAFRISVGKSPGSDGCHRLISETVRCHGLTIKSLEEQFSEASLEESPPASSHLDEIDCDFCGKNYDSSDIPVVPEIIGDTYRLELKTSGCFCCTKTGIKFEVKRAVTLEFEQDSWDNYKELFPLKASEVLGPLFKVTTPLPPDTVSAVHLPHNLCLKKFGGDRSWIRCAHFKDGNLSVETPARILPFHVVLENPSFSSLGVWLFLWNLLPNWLSKRIPIHGNVLLYFTTVGIRHLEYKFHLYLMPSFTSVKENFHQEKARKGFRKLDKSCRTQTVYIKIDYTVKATEGAHITNMKMQVECSGPLEIYTEITINAAVDPIDLWLEKDEMQKIWECRLSKGELEELLLQFQKPTIFQGELEELRTETPQNTRPQGREVKDLSVVEPGRSRQMAIVTRKRVIENLMASEDRKDKQDSGDEHVITQGSTLDPEQPQHENDKLQKLIKKFVSLTSHEIIEEVQRLRSGQDKTLNASTLSEPRPQVSFVDKHREALIDRITNVAPILDALLSKNLLTSEDNDIILAESIPQNRMRKL